MMSQFRSHLKFSVELVQMSKPASYTERLEIGSVTCVGKSEVRNLIGRACVTYSRAGR